MELFAPNSSIKPRQNKTYRAERRNAAKLQRLIERTRKASFPGFPSADVEMVGAINA